MIRALLLSNSRNAGEQFLEYPANEIKDFLGKKVKSVLFVPFAAVDLSFEKYTELVTEKMTPMGYDVTSIHTVADPMAAVQSTDAIMIGGGNTWHLLTRLYHIGILEAVKKRVEAGMPYIGWSAGSNVACPTIKTTNDMPVIEPPSFKAMGLVPFQLNAHYTDVVPPGHRAETRDDRLKEFTIVNPGSPVVGLREGTLLRREGDKLSLVGPYPCRIFQDREHKEYTSDQDLSFLLSKD